MSRSEGWRKGEFGSDKSGYCLVVVVVAKGRWPAQWDVDVQRPPGFDDRSSSLGQTFLI